MAAPWHTSHSHIRPQPFLLRFFICLTYLPSPTVCLVFVNTDHILRPLPVRNACTHKHRRATPPYGTYMLYRRHKFAGKVCASESRLWVNAILVLQRADEAAIQVCSRQESIETITRNF